MPTPLLTSQRLLLAAAALLVINSQLPMPAAGWAGRWLKTATDLAVLPLQATIYHTAVAFAGEDEAPVAFDPASPEQLRSALAEALVEVDRLQQRVNELERRLYLIQRVEELDDDRTRPLSAKVVGVTDTGPRTVLTLDRGSRQGVAPNQTVVYHATVVGRVLAPVDPNSCEVELITAHDTRLQVRVQPRGSDLKYDNIRVARRDDGQAFLAEVAHDSPIGKDADVLLADSVHYADARGRLLGVVEYVTEYTPDPVLLKQLVIRPAVLDVPYFTEVVVLVPADPPGRP
jgi:hypothetical protein